MTNAELIDKTQRLLEQARMPRWLHHFGPKTYEFWQHAIALLIRQECRLSYRRVASLLRGLGYAVPTYSALAKMSTRLPPAFWKLLLSCTTPLRCGIAAMDGVFFSATNPSFHYLRRIDGQMPVHKAVQMNTVIDTRSRKCVALRIRARKRRECIDALHLMRQVRAGVLVADSEYDVEALHEYAKKHGVTTMIPIRKGTHKGFFRNYMRRRFDERVYHQRSIIEAVFSAIKRRSGSYVLARSARGKQAELYARVIAYNLNLVSLDKIFN